MFLKMWEINSYMKIGVCNRWFAIHDIFNTTQHITKRLPDKKPCYDPNDEQLVWLEQTFLPWVEDWKKTDPETFLTDQTYEAIVLTSNSTIHRFQPYAIC